MPAAFSWFLAARYLVTRRVNLLGVGGVAVAVWALIVVIAVFSGFIGEIRENIRVSSPELLLTNLDPDKEHSYLTLSETIEADEDVLSTAPRLSHYGIYYPRTRRLDTTRTQAQGYDSLAFDYVTLIGVDAAKEAEVSDLRRWLEIRAPFRVEDPDRPFHISPKRVRQLNPGATTGSVVAAPPGILLALDRLARQSGSIFPGTPLDIVSADLIESEAAEGGEELIYIRRHMVSTGGFETGHRLFDNGTALVEIEWLRTVLGHDIDRPGSIDLISDLAIRPREGVDLAALATRLTELARPLCGGQVLTWEEQNSVFLGAVDQERGLMKLVLFAVMLVAAFLVYATLHMMVTQKTKDIGILTSMGATQGAVQSIFVLSGLAVAAVGCTLGAVSGYLSVIWLNPVNDWVFANFGQELFPRRLYDMEEVPYRLDWDWILTVVLAAVALSLVVAWLPARRAARMEPVQALSYE